MGCSLLAPLLNAKEESSSDSFKKNKLTILINYRRENKIDIPILVDKSRNESSEKKSFDLISLKNFI
jgi:hypothetical protein